MDTFDNFITLVLIVFGGILLYAGIQVESERMVNSAICEQKGGVYLKAYEHYRCVSGEAIIELKTK